MLPSRKRKIRLMIYISLILFLMIFVFIKIDRDIKPVLFSVSDAEAKILAIEAINRTVKEELSNNVKYSDFVNIKTDSNGDISAIEMNTIEMNRFGSSVALKVQEEMKFLGGRGIEIPVGVLTGSTLFSYFGPKIHVKVLPYGNVSTEFKSEIESSGINQSRYRVYIVVNVDLQLMIPLGQEKIDVSSSVPIAETLIVGKVPSSYFSSGSGGSSMPYVVPVPAPSK